MVELASLLVMDSVDRHNKLAVTTPIAIVLALPLLSDIPSLVGGLGLSLALVLA